MLKVGCCYDNGQGVTQDFTKSFEWYLKAANNEDADAMFSAGLCYSNGKGMTRDNTMAFEWYLKSAHN